MRAATQGRAVPQGAAVREQCQPARRPSGARPVGSNWPIMARAERGNRTASASGISTGGGAVTVSASLSGGARGGSYSGNGSGGVGGVASSHLNVTDRAASALAGSTSAIAATLDTVVPHLASTVARAGALPPASQQPLVARARVGVSDGDRRRSRLVPNTQGGRQRDRPQHGKGRPGGRRIGRGVGVLRRRNQRRGRRNGDSVGVRRFDRRRRCNVSVSLSGGAGGVGFVQGGSGGAAS